MVILQPAQSARVEQSVAISALVGLAPLNRDSGKMRGKRSILGERAPVPWQR